MALTNYREGWKLGATCVSRKKRKQGEHRIIPLLYGSCSGPNPVSANRRRKVWMPSVGKAAAMGQRKCPAEHKSGPGPQVGKEIKTGTA